MMSEKFKKMKIINSILFLKNPVLKLFWKNLKTTNNFYISSRFKISEQI